MPRRRGDHRGVVGAEVEGDELEANAPRSQTAAARSRRWTLAATPSAQDHRDPGSVLQHAIELGDELRDDRCLEARREIRATGLGLALGEIAAGVDERGLQSAEAEVEAAPVVHRDRERERPGIPRLGLALDRRTARIPEAEGPGRRVEGLARRVVEVWPRTS